MNNFLLAGLGNPGEKYQNTRHNLGFMVIDAIASQLNFPIFSNKFSSLISSKIADSYKITLIKPQTFMNLSGEAIAKALHFYKIPLENLIVVHDDLDLELAKVKMKIGGGSGGHNGIKSIDQHLGNGYYRLRIGIGKPNSLQEVSSFVLDDFSKEESAKIDKLINLLLENIDLILARNIPNLMNRLY